MRFFSSAVQVSRGNKRPFFGILELSRRKLGSIHCLRKNIHCSFSPVLLSLQAVGRSWILFIISRYFHAKLCLCYTSLLHICLVGFKGALERIRLSFCSCFVCEKCKTCCWRAQSNNPTAPLNYASFYLDAKICVIHAVIHTSCVSWLYAWYLSKFISWVTFLEGVI